MESIPGLYGPPTQKGIESCKKILSRLSATDVEKIRLSILFNKVRRVGRTRSEREMDQAIQAIGGVK